MYVRNDAPHSLLCLPFLMIAYYIHTYIHTINFSPYSFSVSVSAGKFIHSDAHRRVRVRVSPLHPVARSPSSRDTQVISQYDIFNSYSDIFRGVCMYGGDRELILRRGNLIAIKFELGGVYRLG